MKNLYDLTVVLFGFARSRIYLLGVIVETYDEEFPQHHYLAIVRTHKFWARQGVVEGRGFEIDLLFGLIEIRFSLPFYFSIVAGLPFVGWCYWHLFHEMVHVEGRYKLRSTFYTWGWGTDE